MRRRCQRSAFASLTLHLDAIVLHGDSADLVDLVAHGQVLCIERCKSSKSGGRQLGGSRGSRTRHDAPRSTLLNDRSLAARFAPWMTASGRVHPVARDCFRITQPQGQLWGGELGSGWVMCRPDAVLGILDKQSFGLPVGAPLRLETLRQVLKLTSKPNARSHSAGIRVWLRLASGASRREV